MHQSFAAMASAESVNRWAVDFSGIGPALRGHFVKSLLKVPAQRDNIMNHDILSQESL